MIRFIKNKFNIKFRIFFAAMLIGFTSSPSLALNRNASESDLGRKDFFPLDTPEKAVSYEFKSNKWHAENVLTIQKPDPNNNRQYKFTVVGNGTYDQYENVDWVKEALAIDEPDGLKTLSSQWMIKDTKKAVVDKIKNTYNYETNEVIYERWHQNGAYKKKIFDIKGPISDEVTMVQFLRDYVANAGEDGYDYFYLLTKMPNLYKVRVKKLHEEVLEINGREINTVKLQLKADLGPLTEILAALISPTYLWYESEYPYRWVQYEGMDSGRKSKHIKGIIKDG